MERAAREWGWVDHPVGEAQDVLAELGYSAAATDDLQPALNQARSSALALPFVASAHGYEAPRPDLSALDEAPSFAPWREGEGPNLSL